MGPESGSSSSSSPSGKRSRDVEDEVYIDNLHSHKRYLSEIMASSLNGLTVGDPPPENLMESPARSESSLYSRPSALREGSHDGLRFTIGASQTRALCLLCYAASANFRDDISLQYSPMSEDLDDSRYCETQLNSCSSQPDSVPTSPVSPCRNQRAPNGFSSISMTSFPITSSQPRQRGNDSEGRFPSSPSDICHSADLRRAALLRSVQMRTQPTGPSSYELPFSTGQESVPIVEDLKSSFVDERVSD